MAEFDAEDIVRLRAALGRISRLLDRQVSGGGMTQTQLSVLATVARQGPLGVSELAEVEGINPTMLSRVLSKLAESGLILRSTDAGDRRAVQVVATDAGSRLHRMLRDERARLLAERLERIPAGHAQRLLAALPALESLAEKMAKEPAPGPTPEPTGQPAPKPRRDVVSR